MARIPYMRRRGPSKKQVEVGDEPPREELYMAEPVLSACSPAGIVSPLLTAVPQLTLQTGGSRHA